MKALKGGHPPLEAYSKDLDDLKGRLLDGRFLIESALGKGAMGLVLGARELATDRRVAVKLLNPSVVDLEVNQARFVREAQASRHVKHAHVIETFDFGATESGLHFMVMEFLEGADLYRYATQQGQLDPLLAANIAVQMCDALQAIHDAGFVHRDLKPENVWVSNEIGSDGFPLVKIIDFGIAGLVEDADGSYAAEGAGIGNVGKKLTKTGHTVGTVHYMAPEQAMSSKVDGRADIYSMACIIWELVTGRCTFEATTHMQIMMKQLTEDPEPPSSVNPAVPPWFDVAVLKCMAKRPEDRYRSARDAGAAFRSGMEGSRHDAGGTDWRSADTEVDPTGFVATALEARHAPTEIAVVRTEPQPASHDSAHAGLPPTTEVRRPAQRKGNQLALWISIAALVVALAILLATR